MKKLLLLVLIFLSISSFAQEKKYDVAVSATERSGYGPDYYGKRDEWLRKAEEAKPELIERKQHPLYLVQPVADPDAWKAIFPHQFIG